MLEGVIPSNKRASACVVEFSNEPGRYTFGAGYNRQLGNPSQNNIYSGVGTSQDHKSTPKVFGGAYIDYRISPKFGINVNPYFLHRKHFIIAPIPTFVMGEHGVDEIEGKLKLNS